MKMKRTAILKISIFFFLSIAFSLGIFQVSFASEKTVYYFKAYDLTGYINPETGNSSTLLGMSDYVALKIVQGVVNRTEPTLFIDQSLNYYTDSDIHWRAYYESKGYTFIELDTIGDVYNTFKGSFAGVVTFNHTITTDFYHWPELDMAAVVSSLTNRIPILSSQVSKFQANYGLSPSDTITLTDSFTDYPDTPSDISGRLETYGWTTPLQVYQWGYDNLLKFCNPHEFHNMTAETFDLAAERKMFHTYLMSTDVEQFNLLKSIYSYYDAKNASFPVWGWVKQEDIDLHAMAPYGGYIKMAGSTNLSFHNKIPTTQQNFTQKENYTIDNTILDNNKYYVTFTASENDTPKAVTTFQHGAWLDSNRGNVPINWGFEASMVDETPVLADYYYSSATNNDYFFSGGATPLGFADYDDMPTDAQNDIKQRGSVLMRKTDQRFLDLYSGYGAIGAFDPAAYGDLGDALGLDAMVAEVPSGDYQVWSNTFVSGRSNMYPSRQTDFGDQFSGSASKWTTESGTWTIESGEFSQSDTNPNPSSAFLTDSTHSYVNAEVTVKKQSSVTGSAGISFRKGTGANYYWFYLKDGNKAGLKKVVNGTETILGAEANFTHAADTFYKLKVVASGTSIKCYIDNQLVADVTDATFASGNLGLASDSSHAHFDDIKAVVTTQAQEIINFIKSKTVDAAKTKPYFLSGYYGYMFTGDYEKSQVVSEPGAGEVMAATPTILKEVQDTLNAEYPEQFKFARMDEMISAQRIYANSVVSSEDNLHDDLNDWSKVYSHSGSLYFDTGSPEYLNGDASRLVRNSNTEEYLVYKTPSATKDITSFSTTAWYWPDESPTDMAFYTSPDNTTYLPFTPSKTTVNGTGAGWNQITYNGSDLPAGTKYVKILYKQNTTNYWNPQLGSVDISSSQSGTIMDDLNDWTNVFSHSASLYFDTGPSANFNGDASRLARNSNTEEYLVYKTPSVTKDITGFSTTAWYWPDESPTDFAFYTSPDNTTYLPFTPSKTMVNGTGAVWNQIIYNGSDLPAGTKYVKILYKQSTTNYWNPQLGSVEIQAGNVIPQAPVGLTANVAGMTSIDLSWTSSGGSNSYNVYRASSANGNFEKINSIAVVATTYSDTGLAAGTTYYYKVTAVNNIGESALSPQVSGSTDNPDTETTSILTGPASVIAGKPFDVIYGLSNVTERVYAKELTVSFDPTQLKLTSFESLINGFNVVDSTSVVPGKVRILMSSTNPNSTVTGTENILELHFLTLPTVQTVTSSVYVSNVIIADANGVNTQVTSGPIYYVQINVIDKAKLATAIADAQTRVAAVSSGSRWGQYPQSAVDALNQVIGNVKLVLNNDNASNHEVTQAVSVLSAALEVFEGTLYTEATVGDLAIIASHYGITSDSTGWANVQRYDFDHDSKLDIADLAAMAKKILAN